VISCADAGIAAIVCFISAVEPNGVPQGSSGSPEKIADVIAFVASDKASFMKGEVVTVGGDLGAS